MIGHIPGSNSAQKLQVVQARYSCDRRRAGIILNMRKQEVIARRNFKPMWTWRKPTDWQEKVMQ